MALQRFHNIRFRRPSHLVPITFEVIHFSATPDENLKKSHESIYIYIYVYIYDKKRTNANHGPILRDTLYELHPV